MVPKTTHDTSPLLFAWPSAGQRGILVESIEGCARHLKEHGKNNPLLLSIDGREADLAPDIRKALEKLRAQYPEQLHIADLNTRLALLESLPSPIDKEIASYALLHQKEDGTVSRGPGFNRNMMFLSAAGGLLVSTDDDILFRPAVQKNTIKGTSFSSQAFPVPLFYCTDRAALLSDIRESSCDIAEQHRQFLGQKAVVHISGEIPPSASQGRILLTSAGCYGDSGFGSARTVLTIKGSAREYLMRNGYEQTCYSREVIKIPEQNLISSSMFFMAGHSGYDVREYLPPFFPFVGNEDGFFAMLTRICNPNSLNAYPSFGLLHDPPETRPYSRESLVGFKPCITELLMALTLSCLPNSSLLDSRSRMIQLGHNFVEKSNLPTVAFVDLLHQCWMQGAMAYVEVLEELLDTHERQPAQWASDVDELLENIYIKIREPRLLFGETGCRLTVEQVIGHLRRYGNLLTVWPDLLDFAIQKNSKR